MKYLVLLAIFNVFASVNNCNKYDAQQSFLANYDNESDFIDFIKFKKHKGKNICMFKPYNTYRDAFLNRMTLFVEKAEAIPSLGTDVCLFQLLQVDQKTGDSISMPFARIGGPYYALDPRCIKGLHPNNSTRQLAMQISKNIYKLLKNNSNETDTSIIIETKTAAAALNKHVKLLSVKK
jgi:hypothetical protein